MNAAVRSALNPAKVSFITLWKPGSITAQVTSKTVWLESDISFPQGMQGGIAYACVSPPTYTASILGRASETKLGSCHIPFLQLLVFPLKKTWF